jgi:hypothetical protein
MDEIRAAVAQGLDVPSMVPAAHSCRRLRTRVADVRVDRESTKRRKSSDGSNDKALHFHLFKHSSEGIAVFAVTVTTQPR